MVAADNNLGFIPTEGPLRNVFYDGPDRLVGFTNAELIVWDGTTHERISSIALPAPPLDGGFANSVRVSLAAGRAAWVDSSFAVHTVRLDRLEAPQTLGPEAVAVALHPDGERIAIAGVGGDVRLVNIPSAEQRWVIPGDPARTFDDQTELDLSYLPALANIDLRNVSYMSASLAFAPGGGRLIHAYGVLVHDIDVATGARTRTVDTVQPGGLGLTHSAQRLTFTGDQNPRLIASASVALSTYDGSTLEQRSRFNPVRRQSIFPRAVAGLPSGELAVLDGGGELALVSERDGTVLDGPFSARVGQGNALAISPDGSRIVIAGEQGAVVLALDGGGPIKASVPRRPDEIILAAAHDGSWLSVQPAPQTPFPGSRYWDCPSPPAPCHPLPASDIFAGGLSAPTWAPALALSTD